jgi:hypothetical protein
LAAAATDVLVDLAEGGDAALFPPEDPIAYTRTAITITARTAPTAKVRRRRAMVLARRADARWPAGRMFVTAAVS